MNEQDALSQIQEHRVAINALDEKILALLNDRARESLAIRALKPDAQMSLYDSKREEEIFERLIKVNTGPLYAEDVRSIYATVLKVMKELR